MRNETELYEVISATKFLIPYVLLPHRFYLRPTEAGGLSDGIFMNIAGLEPKHYRILKALVKIQISWNGSSFGNIRH